MTWNLSPTATRRVIEVNESAIMRLRFAAGIAKASGAVATASGAKTSVRGVVA
jgi:hypothetical protein